MTVRLTFPISDEIHRSLCLIPHGLRKYTYQHLIYGLAQALEEDAPKVIAQIIAKQVDVTKMLQEGLDNEPEQTEKD